MDAFYLIVITTLFSGSLIWILKIKADLKNGELNNLDKAASIWKKLNDGQEKRISMLEREVKELKLNSCIVKNCQNRKTA